MKRINYAGIVLSLLLATGLSVWFGSVSALADSIPDNAVRDSEEYTIYIDPEGCTEDEHLWHSSGGRGTLDCETDYYEYFECQYCYTHYYVLDPAGEHDYYLSYEEPADCYNSGLLRFYCSKCNDYYEQTQPALGHDYVTKITKANATKQTRGKSTATCSRCGSCYSESWPYPYIVKLSKDIYVNNGKQKKPTVTVIDLYGDKIAKSNYEVTYKNNVKPGVGIVNVKFKGKKYAGSLSTDFLIKPQKVTGVKVSYKADAKIVVKWKASPGASGYKVEYSTSSKFPDDGRTCIKIYGAKKREATISYMAKKKYYVRVCGLINIDGTEYKGAYSGKETVTIKKGTSITTMLSHLKSTLDNRKAILKATDNGVDIKKYDTTLKRIKAIYTWHAKNSGKFAHCLACNSSFNYCIDMLINEKQYDNWIRMGSDRYKNNSGSVVMHKWSVLFLQGVPYIFDPRMQGNIGSPSSFTYFAVAKGSSTAKHYLFDEYIDWEY